MRHTLLLSCEDQPGIVAAVAGFVAERGGNILDAEQHRDEADGVFFQRVEFDVDVDGDAGWRPRFEDGFAPLVERFGFAWSLHTFDQPLRVAVLASKQGHCLHDLLARWHQGELPIDLRLVISNHDEQRPVTEAMGVGYHHLPVSAETRSEQEGAVLELLADEQIDLVVLARYMQILTERIVEVYPHRIINIHHSFLPAFPGGRPYHQAHARGVKIVGVTAHYATVDLDEGPIIEQDVVRVSHRDSVEELARRGRDLEKIVLARAVRAHVERRVLVYGNRTVVFGS